MPPKKWQMTAARPTKRPPARNVPRSSAHIKAPRLEFQPSPDSDVETAKQPTMALTTPAPASQKGSATSAARFASINAVTALPPFGTG